MELSVSEEAKNDPWSMLLFPQPVLTPQLLGYYARKHDLTLQDVLADGRWDKVLDASNAEFIGGVFRDEFEAGWWACDKDLKLERLASFLWDLRGFKVEKAGQVGGPGA